ncbi:MAG: MerR family DNA-binding transcriptional regulator [Alphaproteobacteria bacterium]|nr:MerR family DNA-binding transcriptional regulator [Alphaproteobacteria bacterium]MBL6938733.1 MerR family DNA-binding transcriptional regulator [Alphaproteobacteria bacterium]MBL7097910.1 MerR family DNA-binding transcriptional regulator [Alphaproteobacteria bacterium]
MHHNRTFTIRQLTKEFEVTARTLRFYEDEGLIAPERRGQTRIYSGRDRARITLILRGRRVGFSLAEIREILDLYDQHHDRGVAQTLHARKKFEEQLHKLERQKVDIEESLGELHRAIAAIDQAMAEGVPTAPSVEAHRIEQHHPHRHAAE